MFGLIEIPHVQVKMIEVHFPGGFSGSCHFPALLRDGQVDCAAGVSNTKIIGAATAALDKALIGALVSQMGRGLHGERSDKN